MGAPEALVPRGITPLHKHPWQRWVHQAGAGTSNHLREAMASRMDASRLLSLSQCYSWTLVHTEETNNAHELPPSRGLLEDIISNFCETAR